MNKDFDKAFQRVLDYEGGYTNDPNDRGNWTTGIIGKGLCNGTKYGISAMSYPSLDIKNLTKEEAKEIYYKDFWLKNNLDKLSSALAFQVFDACIQHGASRAVKFLQRIVGSIEDGVLGLKTITAITSHNQIGVALIYVAKRMDFYLQQSKFNLYGKGWVNRMLENYKELLKEYQSIYKEESLNV